jgi:hypothetical protein
MTTTEMTTTEMTTTFSASLEQIRTLADGDDGSYVFWLSGLAGTEKSAIARTIAREYWDKGCLVASFFSSTGPEDVRHAGKFVATIAVQLAQVPGLEVKEEKTRDEGKGAEE